MNRWQISFPIDGLHDVIKEPGPELTIDKVKFHYRENQRIGSAIVEADKQSDADKEAAYQINRALAKICFAYNTEASIDESGFYYKDLSKEPSGERVATSLGIRWSYVKEEPQTTLSNIDSITSTDRLATLELALAYYKQGEYANPLRIESFFSCMTVMARDLLSKKPNDDVKTGELKKSIKTALQQTGNNFDESQFDKDWIAFYSDERCSIAHGRGSKLIDPRKLAEYDRIVNTVGGWARDVIYYYIDIFKANG